jgi:hypothetical protein
VLDGFRSLNAGTFSSLIVPGTLEGTAPLHWGNLADGYEGLQWNNVGATTFNSCGFSKLNPGPVPDSPPSLDRWVLYNYGDDNGPGNEGREEDGNNTPGALQFFSSEDCPFSLIALEMVAL